MEIRPLYTKRLKLLRNRSEYIITSPSRLVVQNFTEIGSPILGGKIGKFELFYLQTHTHTHTHTHTNIFFVLPTPNKYGRLNELM